MNHRKHAIVIGGSMGGLVAARVLADRFESVTLLERDQFPPVGDHRRGVPQSHHTHGLLASGRQVLERLFPGLVNELFDAGALGGDIVRDGRWFHEGGYLSRFTSGIDGVLLSRPLLEGMVRKHLLALPNVRAIEDCQVLNLIASEDRATVTGVRASCGGCEETMTADLVVDATGRGSHASQWLGELDYPKPPVESVEVSLGYTTRLFRRRPQQLDGTVAVILPPTPEGKKGGVMLAQEGDRWTVTLIAHFGNYAPTDLEGFREFARNLHAPDIYEVIRASEPIGEPRSARFPASVRRRYERLERFPEGFVVFGDAICSFNPIYGQGMSVAALQSEALAQTLAEDQPRLAQRFFRRAAKIVDTPWAIAVGNDLRMPETVGPRNLGVRFINWYMSKLHKAAHHDPVPALAFHRVANLLAPPPSVMHPKVALRVLLGNLRRSPSPAPTVRPQTWTTAAGR